MGVRWSLRFCPLDVGRRHNIRTDKNRGLIVTAGGIAFHRNLIIKLAARYNRPAVYPFRYYATDGGLISYGPDTHDPIERAVARSCSGRPERNARDLFLSGNTAAAGHWFSHCCRAVLRVGMQKGQFYRSYTGGGLDFY
jgi:hypothetical protein